MKTSTILVGMTCVGLGGCGSSVSESSEPTDELVAFGGMDGAGSIGVGLDGARGITFQPLWEGGAAAYVVSNGRDEDVDLKFVTAACTDVGPEAGCTYGDTVATWSLPAQTLRKVSGADAEELSLATGLVGVFANTGRLGLLVFPELTPFASELAVVNNAGINTTSANGFASVQIETDFLVAPRASFDLELALSEPGDVTLASTGGAAAGLRFVDVVSVESSDATVQVIEDDFVVRVPESASAGSPVRVAVEVRLPDDFSGKVVGFGAWFCSETSEGQCQRGHHFGRAIPIETPLP